jgi:hypothetical protein
MNKKITLGPRVPIVVMAVLLSIFAFGGALLDASGQPHPLHVTFYLEWVAINVLALAVSYWWLTKALKIPDWENWAQMHNGKYERPDDMYITAHGSVLDKLSGVDPSSHKPFYLYRVFKVSNFSRVWPSNSPTSSVLLSDSNEIIFPHEFEAKKNYIIHVPTVEEMLDLRHKQNGLRPNANSHRS